MEDGAIKQMFPSILIKREDIQSYLERKTTVNDFRSFLQDCYAEKKKRDLIAKEKTITSFKVSIKKHIMNNIEGDCIIQLLPEDKSVVEAYLNEYHIPHAFAQLSNGLFKLTIPREALHN